MDEIYDRSVFSNTNERKQEEDGLYSRDLRSAATMELLFMTSFRLVGNDFRSRGFNYVEGDNPPLSNANFNDRINGTFFFAMVDLYRDKIRLVETSETCAFVFGVGIYQDARHFFRSMDAGGQDATMMFMRFASFFQSFGPYVNLIGFLVARFFDRGEVRIFHFRQLFYSQIREER